ncbi:hypothetical protein [Defluviimonas salinarum]|uniref:Terminase small subunit n=1 Tax=Defluviimonas salinarum TaxID=2992147 RepID=A0ABT3J7B6_9RHOB|nr:hypothetical protein [Defluviimonas salinarum]MCW3783572.1 hypothetical protein [Defluviimonas salinarum]
MKSKDGADKMRDAGAEIERRMRNLGADAGAEALEAAGDHVWTTAEGDRIALRDMGGDHLINLIRHTGRKIDEWTAARIAPEASGAEPEGRPGLPPDEDPIASLVTANANARLELQRRLTSGTGRVPPDADRDHGDDEIPFS